MSALQYGWKRKNIDITTREEQSMFNNAYNKKKNKVKHSHTVQGLAILCI